MKEFKDTGNPEKSFFLFGALVILSSSVVRLGGCLYLPAIPAIGSGLNISDSDMASTVTFYFVVFALSSLLAGPFSDAFGRKPVVVCGTFFFIAGSVCCYAADSYAVLMAGRILQAFGASMIPGTGRAMIRDYCNDVQVVSLMGWLAVLGSVMFVGAPTLGGILTSSFGWRSNFVFLSIFSVIVIFLILFFLPETLSGENRTHLSLSDTAKNYMKMLQVPRFSFVIFPLFLAFIFQGAYLSSASFIFINEFSFTPEAFGYTNIILLIGLFLGRNTAVKLSEKKIPEKAFLFGALLAPCASLILAALLFFGDFKLVLLLAALLVFSTSVGIIIPISMKVSISAFNTRCGETASLQAFIALFGSAAGALCVTLAMHFFPNCPVVNIFVYVSVILGLMIPISAVMSAKYIK